MRMCVCLSVCSKAETLTPGLTSRGATHHLSKDVHASVCLFLSRDTDTCCHKQRRGATLHLEDDGQFSIVSR